MAERYQQQSPLAHLHLAARQHEGDADTAVRLVERAFRCQINLRGNIADTAFAQGEDTSTGLSLPTVPNRFSQEGSRQALWLGPDEWLLVLDGEDEMGAAEGLRQALAGQHVAVTEVGHARTVIGLSGPRARDALGKGCPLDLHPRAFGPRQCAQTLLARTDMILLQLDGAPSYEINVRRSLAHYVWTWLEDAAREYGYTAVEDSSG